jgi:hypothetical protein
VPADQAEEVQIVQRAAEPFTHNSRLVAAVLVNVRSERNVVERVHSNPGIRDCAAIRDSRHLYLGSESQNPSTVNNVSAYTTEGLLVALISFHSEIVSKDIRSARQLA